MRRIVVSITLVCVPLTVATLDATAAPITIDTVPVGNAGNAPDQDYGQGQLGSVPYEYRIGTTEVTNSQYVAFLNAVDPIGANPLELYSADMTSDARGGISYSAGNSDGSKYNAKPNMGDKPVNYVTFYDSLRFINWLNSGDTESGAYTLEGGTPEPSNFASITRDAGAIWFLPSLDEWYKAAYHDPRSAAEGGPPGNDHYWLYPTSSDTLPTMATATTTGDIANPGANVANYGLGADWNAQDGNVTTVGSAGVLSDSYYGTFDQGGNVTEWIEQSFSGGVNRGRRGGAWEAGNGEALAASKNTDITGPNGQASNGGFRVASIATPTPGDANGDGHVDGLDYLIWADHYGQTEPPELTFAEGDFVDDGVIDGVDYLVWAGKYGQGPNDAVPVPEPSSLLCTVMCALVIAAFPRRVAA